MAVTMTANHSYVSPRLASLGRLKTELLPAFFGPDLPSDETIRRWFREAAIPFYKSNRCAKRGGGQVMWEVAGVEKFLKSRVRPAVAKN